MNPRRRIVSTCIVIAMLVAALQLYVSQTTTMNFVIISPPDGAELRTSPVELIATVTSAGFPLGGVMTTITVNDWTRGQVDTEIDVTDSGGAVILLFPAMPGNYSWQVTATMEGYTPIVSSSRSFSVKLLLVVKPLLPSTSVPAVSPVGFRARVTGMNGRPVQSAWVTFYVDSVMIGSNLTGQNGIAQLSKALTMGRHTWFASADKEGEGGISDITLFIVGQLASLVIGDSIYEALGSAGVWNHIGCLPTSQELRATRMRSSSALNE